ncbi:hypothetical protein ACOMHN_067559 [Nucella lapillus]
MSYSYPIELQPSTEKYIRSHYQSLGIKIKDKTPALESLLSQYGVSLQDSLPLRRSYEHEALMSFRISGEYTFYTFELWVQGVRMIFAMLLLPFSGQGRPLVTFTGRSPVGAITVA